MDLTKDPKQRAVLKLIFSRQSMTRPFAPPPGLPAARVAALRRAFGEAVKDLQFLAEMKKLDLEVRPVDGVEVEALVREIYAVPPEIVKLAAQSITEGSH